MCFSMPTLDSSFWHRLGPRGVNDEVGDEVAQVYLAAFTYRFNRRFDLRGHVERLIDEVARTPPIKEKVVRRNHAEARF